MKELEELLQHIIEVEIKKHIDRVEAEKVFNASEAAEYLRISRDWLYKNLDKIPHADVGGYKFLKSDLDNYIKEKTKNNAKVHIKDYKGSGTNYKVV